MVRLVGLFVEPNGANVVPGRVVFDFEIRSLDQYALNQMVEHMQTEIANVEKSRNVSITMNQLSHSNAIIVTRKMWSRGLKKVVNALEQPFAYRVERVMMPTSLPSRTRRHDFRPKQRRKEPLSLKSGQTLN